MDPCVESLIAKRAQYATALYARSSARYLACIRSLALIHLLMAHHNPPAWRVLHVWRPLRGLLGCRVPCCNVEGAILRSPSSSRAGLVQPELRDCAEPSRPSRVGLVRERRLCVLADLRWSPIRRCGPLVSWVHRVAATFQPWRRPRLEAIELRWSPVRRHAS